jgi:hypothetical protein
MDADPLYMTSAGTEAVRHESGVRHQARTSFTAATIMPASFAYRPIVARLRIEGDVASGNEKSTRLPSIYSRVPPRSDDN